MSMINELPRIFCSAYEEYKKLNKGSFNTIMESGSEDKSTLSSLLIWSDNRKSLLYLAQEGYAGKVQMIYADPPFFSKSDYKAAIKIRCADGKNKNVKVHAYDDRWGNDISNYINEMVL